MKASALRARCWTYAVQCYGDRLRGFIPFAITSGLCWLLDMSLAYSLIHRAHLSVFAANLTSASCAAALAFLISRAAIFQSRGDALASRMGFYLVYTCLAIYVASAAVSLLTNLLSPLLEHAVRPVAPATVALFAKTVVTPFNMLANFFVARYVSEYESSYS